MGRLVRLMGLVMMDRFRSSKTCGVGMGMHGLGRHAMHWVAMGGEGCVGRVGRRRGAGLVGGDLGLRHMGWGGGAHGGGSHLHHVWNAVGP